MFGAQSWMTKQLEWVRNAQIGWHAKHMTGGMPENVRSKKDLPLDGKAA